MDYRKILKEIGRGKKHARDLDIDTARALYTHMLNSEIPDLELGGILMALRIKGEGEAELRGFYDAMQHNTIALTPPAGRPMPVVIPGYNGARRQANLTPLLAILLCRLGFPVLVHGVSEDPTRVISETIFELLGMHAVHSAGQAQAKLEESRSPVIVPVGTLCPSMEKLLALRWRLGVRSSAHTLAKLATPFASGEALRLASVSHPEYAVKVAQFFTLTKGRALLMQGTEGEVYANPQRCPRMSLIDEQGVHILYEREEQASAQRVVLPLEKDAETTARWTERCAAGGEPVPQSIKIQLACCLVASGEERAFAAAIRHVNAVFPT
ncbi:MULTISPECIES: DNA-binding protein YbiB [Tenebrionibacter/Tenebrionicola group]|jgi:anthranilate phosphoribosyltransferase|uniref:DNA-binding protein YbiB n=2 Tax=Tenebrionibacter/Tenebrionicola group TaxID=2969848 RepID=A0A8K0XWS0_9ENTR|nr:MULTISPECIES: DNA-binding protein YbiB [Tenebrionibacter/Tenebrionicola group]MBK4714557.1 DNA-binding protein YbiB [Tenebrionibacter intestinalis]MBV5095389.1 DNA-binding protein YbiB [Tenebrionicola larvae]